MYILAEDNGSRIDVAFELTEKEYNEIARTIRKKRAETVQKLIKELAETIGIAETKSMIRETLRGL